MMVQSCPPPLLLSYAHVLHGFLDFVCAFLDILTNAGQHHQPDTHCQTDRRANQHFVHCVSLPSKRISPSGTRTSPSGEAEKWRMRRRPSRKSSIKPRETSSSLTSRLSALMSTSVTQPRVKPRVSLTVRRRKSVLRGRCVGQARRMTDTSPSRAMLSLATHFAPPNPRRTISPRSA